MIFNINNNRKIRTTHSQTTARRNALISIKVEILLIPDQLSQINNYVGYGEAGLPPKKPLCYVATFDEVKEYFDGFSQWVPMKMKNAIIIPLGARYQLQH